MPTDGRSAGHRNSPRKAKRESPRPLGACPVVTLDSLSKELLTVVRIFHLTTMARIVEEASGVRLANQPIHCSKHVDLMIGKRLATLSTEYALVFGTASRPSRLRGLLRTLQTDEITYTCRIVLPLQIIAENETTSRTCRVSVVVQEASNIFNVGMAASELSTGSGIVDANEQSLLLASTFGRHSRRGVRIWSCLVISMLRFG